MFLLHTYFCLLLWVFEYPASGKVLGEPRLWVKNLLREEETQQTFFISMIEFELALLHPVYPWIWGSSGIDLRCVSRALLNLSIEMFWRFLMLFGIALKSFAPCNASVLSLNFDVWFFGIDSVHIRPSRVISLVFIYSRYNLFHHLPDIHYSIAFSLPLKQVNFCLF